MEEDGLDGDEDRHYSSSDDDEMMEEAAAGGWERWGGCGYTCTCGVGSFPRN